MNIKSSNKDVLKEIVHAKPILCVHRLSYDRYRLMVQNGVDVNKKLSDAFEQVVDAEFERYMGGLNDRI